MGIALESSLPADLKHSFDSVLPGGSDAQKHAISGLEEIVVPRT